MKCGLRVALGVAGGYFLGRTKKMKLALMLGGMAAGRQAGGPGELLKTGTKLLNSSPELSRLTDEVRGRLLEAGKGALLAVAARQVESLTDRVGKRVESFGDGGVPRRGKKAEAEPEEDEYAEDEYAEDEGAEPDDIAEDEETADEAEARPPARSRAPSGTAAPSRAGKNPATATLRRTAAPAAGTAGKAAAGRRSGRPARTQRSDKDG
ncbi:hypothetical protein GCM10009609_63670 [Pseudonocardia aurantiaca]|uniref:DNA primase n=1 Tax=Pseudonocardia aurantiaca TaxID=75290 RepID=A0ABW4FSL5_9PSEU